MNHEGLVPVFAQHVIKKRIARRALLAQHRALAHAGVHQQPKGQRKVGLLREILDRLRPPILFQRKVTLRQVIDDRSLLVPHRGEHVYQLYVHGNIRFLLILLLIRRLLGLRLALALLAPRRSCRHQRCQCPYPDCRRYRHERQHGHP